MNFTNITKQQMTAASIDAFNCDYKKMEELMKQAMQQLSFEQQLLRGSNVALPGSPAANAMQKYMNQVKTIQQQLRAAGFRPTDKLIRTMEKVNQTFGKEHSVKDVKEYLKNPERLSDVEKQVVHGAAKEFQEQERLQVKKAPPVPER